MRRLATGLARCSAALVLVGALVVLPVAVWAAVGGPGSVDWDAAFGSGRIVSDTVVALGLVVFSGLWLWFAAIAVAEVLRVVAWRRGADTLAPVDPTPSGAVRRLVRIALVSTSTVVGAGLASISSIVPAPAPVHAAVQTSGPVTSPAEVCAPGHRLGDGVAPAVTDVHRPAEIRSNGRETPYSVAVRLGDPSVRERIIELNQGTPGPDGVPWTGGVFPAGMVVRVPEGMLTAHVVEWTSYSVVDGDTVYRIATRLAAGDHRRVRDLADAIIDRNLGRTMSDGDVFDDPSLVRVGWVLDVPASDVRAAAAAHVVEAGESYWAIAAEHVAPPHDTPADVASLADQLQDLNVERLGHDDPTMLHPGDALVLPADAVETPAAEIPAAEIPRAEIPAVEIPAVETPEVVAPAPTTPVPATPVSATPISATPVPATVAPEATAPVPTAPVTTVPVQVPATTAPGATVPSGDDATGAAEVAAPASAPMTTSLAAAVLLCAGALGLVESRRRHQLRRSGPDAVVPVPPTELVRTERLVRSLDAVQRAARLDLALRSAGHLLVGTGGYVRAAIVDDDGTVTVLLDRPDRRPGAPWRDGDERDRWVLDATVGNADLAPMSRLAGQPCPAMVHLGRLTRDRTQPADGDLFVDLEAFGLVCIDATADDTADPARPAPPAPPAPTAMSILRAIATSLAASPMSETLRLVTHGLDPSVHLGNLNADAADDLEQALDLAAAALGSTPTAIGGMRTSELRARGVGGEAWEPVVVVSSETHLSPAATRELLDLTRAGGRSLAVVLAHAVEGASLTLRAAAGGWDLAPLDLSIVPVGVHEQHVDRLAHLLSSAATPLPEAPPATRARTSRPAGDGHDDHVTDPDWALMIRVLGPVDVITRDGACVEFERGKSLEFVAWLGQHRPQASRSSARAALWELAVRDATFTNVVSDARRSIGRAVVPPDGDDWIGRSTTGQLPLHRLVATDADLLRRRFELARSMQGEDAIRVLRPGVALIRGLPFADTDYLWPSAEGITSSLTQLATAAATELARHHLALGDVDGVFWATGQGLLALPGHEELIGLRMRAHAQRGDLAGVRVEWESYERAITADVWSDGEPSPKLLALRRELLNR